MHMLTLHPLQGLNGRIDRIHCLHRRSLPRSASPPIASSVVDFLKFRLFLS